MRVAVAHARGSRHSRRAGCWCFSCMPVHHHRRPVAPCPRPAPPPIEARGSRCGLQSPRASQLGTVFAGVWWCRFCSCACSRAGGWAALLGCGHARVRSGGHAHVPTAISRSWVVATGRCRRRAVLSHLQVAAAAPACSCNCTQAVAPFPVACAALTGTPCVPRRVHTSVGPRRIDCDAFRGSGAPQCCCRPELPS